MHCRYNQCTVKDFEWLDKDSIVLLEQIRTVDKKRLKQHMGMMPVEIMARVEKALAISLSMKEQKAGCSNGTE
ncbi:MAG: type II toxin-antitoxin system PemK/MazF family toxin [Lachnospiraceae bacterium]|nr:type II toxin-antitoxin system PemK/MazF family toxin [Lachnospiraceae bacterium]